MKNAMMKLVLAWCFIVAGCSAAYANSITGFQSGWWWQAAGYAGLGNANENLAFAEYYTTADNAEVTVSFNLLGEYANYVNRVCVYARKYDPSTDGNASVVAKTFERVWDYRDPTDKTGAVLLAQTTDIRQAMSLKGTVAEAGAYVLYVTADINSKAKDGSELPMIGGPRKNLTKLGAGITKLEGGSLGYRYNDSYKAFSYNGNTALREQDKYDASGKRALVMQNRVLFAPNDFYSKYYRIPAIVSTSDGSLLAVSDARKKHIHDITNDIDIILRRSIDNGRTWSTPMTIAKGEAKYKSDGTLDCLNSIGYGDPAFASLPNGDILCAFIHGYGLGFTDNNKKTYDSYSISRDNGQTWSTPQYLCDKNGNKLSIIEKERGNIAPGNMCVVKSGLLAGKVIACFRSFKSASGWRDTNGNYFLVYDPNNNYWQVLQPNVAASSAMFKSSNGTDDEAQLVEVGENKFLMSIRTNGTGQRQFVLLTMSGSTSDVRWSAKNLGQCGMNLKEKANGAMTTFITKDGKEYLLHTVPTTQASASGGTATTTRSGLCVFYALKSDVATGNFTWTKSLCLSDPNDYLDETAQYSSITVQQDGTVGILYEGYPQIIRIEADQVDADDNCDQGGDYLMRSIYMNLRIGDIIDGAQRYEQLPLQPPVITPGTSTFDTNNPTNRPKIVITNPNDLQTTESKVVYNIQIFNEKNVMVAERSLDCEFGTKSVTLKWSDLKTNDGVAFATAVKNNYTVRVNAKCFTGNMTYISPSAITSQMYYFRTPTRKIRIVAKPGDNNGDPSITANGVQADKGVTITAGVGDKVTVHSGHNRAPYEFLYFTSDYAGHKRQYFDPAFKAVSDNPSQYSITMPSEQDFPDNDGGCITIYAVYNQGQIGVMTYTATNYFNSAHNTYSGFNMYRHPYYSEWSSRDGFDGQGGTLYNDASAPAGDSVWVWPTPSADLNLNNGSDAQNVSIVNRLTYPTEYKKNGLDLRARLMSDKSTFENYTAVVMLYNETEGRFMLRSEVDKQQRARAASNDPVYAYYVVNGRSAQFSQGSSIAENAMGVRQWYSGTLPAVTDYMDFDDVLARDGSDGNPTLRMVYFLIYKTGSEDFAIADLTKGSNFAIKVEQAIVADKAMTGINEATTDSNGLLIVGRNSSATFRLTGADTMVTVHNVLGQQVARFALENGGSKTIELPSGVYVAGGQKFIVR